MTSQIPDDPNVVNPPSVVWHSSGKGIAPAVPEMSMRLSNQSLGNWLDAWAKQVWRRRGFVLDALVEIGRRLKTVPDSNEGLVWQNRQLMRVNAALAKQVRDLTDRLESASDHHVETGEKQP